MPNLWEPAKSFSSGLFNFLFCLTKKKRSAFKCYLHIVKSFLADIQNSTCKVMTFIIHNEKVEHVGNLNGNLCAMECNT